MQHTPYRRPRPGWIVLGAAAGILILAVTVLFGLNRWRIDIVPRGDQAVTCGYGTVYADAGADGFLRGSLIGRAGWPLEVTTRGTVDTGRLGEYEIHYEASALWLRGSAVRTVTVADQTPPELTLEQIPGHYTLPGHPYEEEGYRAWDACDGDLTDQVRATERDGEVCYEVTDRAGNTATARRPIFYDDPVPPELLLAGETELQLQAGVTYTEPGWQAADNCDGDLSQQVQVTGDVNCYQSGTYTLTYTVCDRAGNTTEAQRTVTVVPAPQPDSPPVSGKVVYLTFDDGPSQYTDQLLDVLEQYNVKATFFVVGGSYADAIGRAFSAGHAIGLHSATHDYNAIYASEDAYFADLQQIQAVVEAQTGRTTSLIRFPGGSSNTVSRFNPGIMTTLVQDVTDQGYQYFDWNVSSGDAGETTDTETVAQNVIDGIQSHDVSVVLQHDSKGYSVAAVEKIISWGLANGYTFLPLTPGSPTAHHGLNN